jgi:hypothetical protein
MIIALAAIFLCAAVPTLRAQEAATYALPKFDGAIKVDGNLDDEAWQWATTVEDFYVYRPKDATDPGNTKVRMIWSEKHLYIAFECEDDDIWSYSEQNDETLWYGDVVEVFLKPSPASNVYYEFVVAPNGALYDSFYSSRGSPRGYRFKKWSSYTRVATSVDGTGNIWTDDDRGYVVEMAIPIDRLEIDIGTPKDGDVWSVAFCRYDYSKSFEEPLLTMSFPEAPRHGFHCYEGYNTMTFLPLPQQ